MQNLNKLYLVISIKLDEELGKLSLEHSKVLQKIVY